MFEKWLIVGSAVLAVLIAALALTWIPAMLVKAREIRRLRALCRGKLALTYDDGPGLELTPPLVELLRRFGAKATFFLVGFRSLRFPAMCDLLQSEGHQLGCHTNMHRHPWRVMPWQTASDVVEGYRHMARWLPARASFRPPFGKLTTWSWLAAKRHAATVSFWTHDGCDTHESLPDPAAIARLAVDAGGAVVLMHSHDRGGDRQRYVLALTEELLTAARQGGLKVCTMQELQDTRDFASSGGIR